jgi:hypothetical protein
MPTLKDQLIVNKTKLQREEYLKELHLRRTQWVSREIDPVLAAVFNSDYLLEKFKGVRKLKVSTPFKTECPVPYLHDDNKVTGGCSSGEVRMTVDPGNRLATIVFHAGIDTRRDLDDDMLFFVGATCVLTDPPEYFYMSLPRADQSITSFIQDVLHKCVDYFLQQDLVQKFQEHNDYTKYTHLSRTQRNNYNLGQLFVVDTTPKKKRK